MKNWLTKKNVLWIYLAIVFAFLILKGAARTGYCYEHELPCIETLWFVTPLAAGLVPLLFSLFSRDQVFYTWLKFSAVAIPVMLWVIYQSPPSAMGGFLASAMTTTRSETAIQISGLYIVISLILIGIKSWMLRQK